MKKLITLLAIIVSIHLNAQKDSVLKTQQGMVEFNGGNYNGNVANVDAPPDMVENIIKEKFKAQGVKPKQVDGFMVFRNVKVDTGDPANLSDMFIKVEKKSRKEKESSVVYAIVAKPGEITDVKLKNGTPATAVTAATVSETFFAALAPDVKEQVFNKNLTDKQAVLKKSEKKLKDLQDDQSSLEKKIKNLQEDLESNKKAQKNQADELERLRAELADFMASKPVSAGKN